MRERDLDRMLELVEDQYLTAAQDAARRLEQNPPIHWKRWAALAACVAVICAGAFRLLGSMHMGNGAHRGEHVLGGVFDAYVGPVLPLTLAEPAGEVDAVRQVTWDFAGFTDSPPEESSSEHTVSGDVLVTDETMPTNHGGEDRRVTVLYPTLFPWGTWTRMRCPP